MTVTPIRLPQPPARASPALTSEGLTEIIQLDPNGPILPTNTTTTMTTTEGARK